MSNYLPNLKTLREKSINNISFYSFSSQKIISFPAFLTSFSDTFNSNWTNQEVYGRMDPIFNFKNTTRKISVGLDVPSSDATEASLNLNKLGILMKSLYPVYLENGAGDQIMRSPPLFRVSFGNLIHGLKNNLFEADKLQDQENKLSPQNTKANGLLGWLDSVSLNPDIEAGFYSYTDEKSKGDFILPRIFKFTFNLNPIHEHPLGYAQNPKDRVARSGKEYVNFPYLNPIGEQTESSFNQLKTNLGAYNSDLDLILDSPFYEEKK